MAISIFLFLPTLLEPLRPTDGKISLRWFCLHYDKPFRHTPTQQVSSVRSLYSLSGTRVTPSAPWSWFPVSHISYRLLLTAVLHGANQFCADQFCHYWHETFHSALVFCFPQILSHLNLFCAYPSYADVCSSPIPGSFITGPSKGGTELTKCRAMSVIQDKSAEDTHIQVWFLSLGFVWEKCLCLQVVALLGLVHWDVPLMTSVITLWEPSMFQAQCYSMRSLWSH